MSTAVGVAPRRKFRRVRAKQHRFSYMCGRASKFSDVMIYSPTHTTNTEDGSSLIWAGQGNFVKQRGINTGWRASGCGEHSERPQWRSHGYINSYISNQNRPTKIGSSHICRPRCIHCAGDLMVHGSSSSTHKCRNQKKLTGVSFNRTHGLVRLCTYG